MSSNNESSESWCHWISSNPLVWGSITIVGVVGFIYLLEQFLIEEERLVPLRMLEIRNTQDNLLATINKVDPNVRILLKQINTSNWHFIKKHL